MKERIRDQIEEVDEPWFDYQFVWCSDTSREIMLQERITKRYKKTGQERAIDVRCKTPCGNKNCRYNQEGCEMQIERKGDEEINIKKASRKIF